MEGVEGFAQVLGDAAALLGDRLLARRHPGRRDRRVVHELQPRQALLEGQGVFAPETAAHASGVSALLPMLALGIPGSGTAAILLGGLMVWGLNPGPLLFVEHKDFVWGLIASMYLGNIVGLVMVLTTVPFFAAVLRVPFAAIAPMIVVSCAIGAFAIQNAMFDIWLMLAFGVVGYVFKKISIPLAPLTLAMVLGSRAEDSFRLSMIGSNGDMRVFWANGLVGSITTLALVLLFWPLIGRALQRITRR
jgi:TctA family transporter